METCSLCPIHFRAQACLCKRHHHVCLHRAITIRRSHGVPCWRISRNCLACSPFWEHCRRLLRCSSPIVLLQVDSHILSFLQAQRRFNTLGMEYISALAILPGVALIQTCEPLEQAMRIIIAGAIVIIQHFPARSDGPAFSSRRTVHHRREVHGDTLRCDVLVLARRLSLW